MIVQSFPSLRPKIPPVHLGGHRHHTPLSLGNSAEPNAKDRARAVALGITPYEFVRRDKIVREKWLACQFHVGQILTPVQDASREKYGTNIKVEGICKSYHDFHEKDVWPDDDDPFILLVRPERGVKDGGRIICTADFLMKPV